jgi:hypothetical protein
MVVTSGGASMAPLDPRRPPQRGVWQDLALQLSKPRREAASFNSIPLPEKTIAPSGDSMCPLVRSVFLPGDSISLLGKL